MNSSSSIKDYRINKNYHYYRIRANVIGIKLIHASGFHSDYAEYYIRIETDYAKWTLKKKYDELSKLNSYLIDKIPELKKLFPPKRLLKSADTIIGERIKLFKKYFNYLFCNINIFLIDELINFISLKSEIILLFIKKYSMLHIADDNPIVISLKKAYDKLNNAEETKYKSERGNKSTQDIINILENEQNYYESLLKYEMKRQISFNWDEPPSQTPHLFVIREFLINLSEKSENKTEILQTFENLYKKEAKTIRFSTKEIMLLYIGENIEDEETKEFLIKANFNNKKRKKISGDYKYHSSFEFLDPDDDIDNNIEGEDDYYSNNDSKLNGLFNIIGNYNKNIILSIGALDLLDKLIDTEYNPDAEIYINVFKSCEIKDYKMLNLNKIIKSNIGGDKTNLKAMKLLQLIFYDKSRNDYKRTIIEDNEVYKQYKNYLNKFIE